MSKSLSRSHEPTSALVLTALAHGSCSCSCSGSRPGSLPRPRCMSRRNHSNEGDRDAGRRSLIRRVRPTRMVAMPTHRIVRSLVAASLLASPAAAQTPAGWNDFKKLFQSYVDSDKVVGASVVILKAGKETGRFDTGFADRAANVRVDSQTIYHWGSITKSAHGDLDHAAPRSRQALARRQDRALGPRVARDARSVRHDGQHHHPDAAVAHRRISESAPGPTAATSPGNRSSRRRGTSSSR